LIHFKRIAIGVIPFALCIMMPMTLTILGFMAVGVYATGYWLLEKGRA
jgi:hypothetical protein